MIAARCSCGRRCGLLALVALRGVAGARLVPRHRLRAALRVRGVAQADTGVVRIGVLAGLLRLGLAIRAVPRVVARVVFGLLGLPFGLLGGLLLGVVALLRVLLVRMLLVRI